MKRHMIGLMAIAAGSMSAFGQDIFGPHANLDFNSFSRDGGPCVQSDGLSLYYHSNREGGQGETDLWVTRRLDTTAAWQAPVNLGPAVNSNKTDVNPILSFDWLMLFFSSAREGGQGWNDIWVTSRLSLDGQWTTPKNLGPSVNSRYDDNYLCESPHGDMLYLTSARSGGKGGADIWQIPVLSKELLLQFMSKK